MYSDLLQLYISFVFGAKFVLGWETKLLCDPFIGVDIVTDHCSQAMSFMHDIVLADSSPNQGFRRRLFTRDNGDHPSQLPQSFTYGSCAIGVDLDGMSGLAVASTWDALYEKVGTLLTECVKTSDPVFQRKFGGYYKIDGFTFVVANPATVITSGTCLASPPYRGPADNDLSMTISMRAEDLAMRSKDIVTRLIPGKIQGGLAPFSSDTYKGVLVRQQGPWLLSGDTWVPKPDLVSDQEFLHTGGWILFRSMRPYSHCFPLYFPDLFAGSSILPSEGQQEIHLRGAWLAEGVRWRRCRARQMNIIKGLSFQWEWILINAPGAQIEADVPSPHISRSAIHLT
ncbi:hypothetical protein MMC26_002757 [Xylographa opegraphella]|nr:hypothetical protein [Xylographa opegraphella]